MKTTPQQFAHLLAHSSLSESERQTVLDMLPTLNEKQISTIVKTLEKDVKDKKALCKRMVSEQEAIQATFISELDKAELSALSE